MLTALLLPLLTSCTALSPPRQSVSLAPLWQRHQQAVSDMQLWELRGRVSFSGPGRNWSAALDWMQDRDTFRIRLRAPLGQGSVELRGDPHQVSLRGRDGQSWSANSAEELLRLHLGWEMRVRGLDYWIRGLPDPGMAIQSHEIDRQGRLARLRQDDVDIRFLDYDGTAGNAIILPTRLSLHSEKHGFRMHVVISSWET